MNKAKLILFAAILLAVSAVGVVGFVVTRPAVKPAAGRPWLDEQLNLTPQQREQMKAIWTRTMETVSQKISERRRTLRDERDAAFFEMLSPDQRLELEQIQQQYSTGMRELDHQKESAFKKATEETKSILTADQVKLYEQLLSERRLHGDHDGRGDGHHPRTSSPGPDTTPDIHFPRHGGPATRPVAEP